MQENLPGSSSSSGTPKKDRELGLTSLVEGIHRVEQAPETHRRRSELVDRATSMLNDRDFAEFIYDVATEEAVEPAIAFELVFSGLAVCEPSGAGLEHEEMLVETAPEWVQAPPVLDSVAIRERRLRSSLRRLRHFFETAATMDEAIASFVDEPDVQPCGY